MIATAHNWTDLLACEKQQAYFLEILGVIAGERAQGKTIYPKDADIFNAFRYCAFDTLKVVILGQDPYHNHNQAHGLAFSVQKGIAPPPSLINIFTEMKNDVGVDLPNHGCLTDWAKQGVFLLNTVLSVEAHKAHSHAGIGWERFSDLVISKISEHKAHVAFMLWGAHAQKKAALIDDRKHLILKSPHPSPLSAYRGFFGSKPFSKANDWLKSHRLQPINWSLAD
ncbi:MAG: uracil-DNA glycosylase [Francisellaceae bacterium]